MSQKKESIKRINSYLSLYSQEQLDFIYKLISLYASRLVGKGDLMSLTYTKEECGKIDSALPQDYVNKIQEILPSFDTFCYVYNYNEPHTFGVMQNIFEAMHYRMNDLLNNKNFEDEDEDEDEKDFSFEKHTEEDELTQKMNDNFKNKK